MPAGNALLPLSTVITEQRRTRVPHSAGRRTRGSLLVLVGKLLPVAAPTNGMLVAAAGPHSADEHRVTLKLLAAERSCSFPDAARRTGATTVFPQPNPDERGTTSVRPECGAGTARLRAGFSRRDGAP